jgi:hypothetical protein
LIVRKGLPFLTVLCLILSACASPIEVAQRTAQARRTPTATPNLAAPRLTSPPGGQNTQNPDQNANGQPPCSHIPRQDSVTSMQWDNQHQQYRLVQLDPQNGQSLCGSTSIPLEQYLNQAVSPDGKMLGVFNYRDEYYQNGSLSLVDINSWQVYTTTVSANTEINSIVFNAAGDLLAFSFQPKPGQASPDTPLFLFDMKTRQVIASTILDFIPRFMHFTANGKWLEIYGSTAGGDTEQQPIVYALLLWATNLGLAWRQPLSVLDGSQLVGPKDQEKALVTWSPGMAFIPGKDILYLVSANEDKYTIIDYINRSVETKDIHPAPVSWFEQLLALTAINAQARAMWGVQKQAALSADGARLYVTGQSTSTSGGANQTGQPLGPLGLEVIDLKTSTQAAHVDTRAINIQVSPDGKYLLLQSWDNGIPSTDILVAGSLEIVAHLPGQYLVATHTFGNQVILLAIQETVNDSQVSLLDQRTFSSLFTWAVSGKPLWLAY